VFSSVRYGQLLRWAPAADRLRRRRRFQEINPFPPELLDQFGTQFRLPSIFSLIDAGAISMRASLTAFFSILRTISS
jgi:hypothetical protein